MAAKLGLQQLCIEYYTFRILNGENLILLHHLLFYQSTIPSSNRRIRA